MAPELVTILLVEDNPDHAELILRSLQEQHESYAVHHVMDGEEALDYLFHRRAYADPKLAPRPNLILLDLSLPKIDGLEVLKEIKNSKQLAHIPAVILTTSQAPQDLAAAYDNRANSYLVKPVGLRKFRQLIDEICTYWLSWNCQPVE